MFSIWYLSLKSYQPHKRYTVRVVIIVIWIFKINPKICVCITCAPGLYRSTGTQVNLYSKFISSWGWRGKYSLTSVAETVRQAPSPGFTLLVLRNTLPCRSLKQRTKHYTCLFCSTLKCHSNVIFSVYKRSLHFYLGFFLTFHFAFI